MIDPGKSVKESSAPPSGPLTGKKLVTAILFGLAFGFLLQKGAAGKYNILLGQLLLQDFTVLKIMGTAIVVGMVGVFTLHHFAKVNLHLQPTKIGAQIIGGLIFGAGFALIAYCPGTGAAALGQGSWDALFGMAGLAVGSYIFAELSGWLKETVETWGNKGKLSLAEVFHVRRSTAIVLMVALLTAGLFALNRLTGR
jgi:uncharacterized protein